LGWYAEVEVDINIVDDVEFIAAGTCRARSFAVIVSGRSAEDDILVSPRTCGTNFLGGSARRGGRLGCDGDVLPVPRTRRTLPL
jgi:hypothetical protein